MREREKYDCHTHKSAPIMMIGALDGAEDLRGDTGPEARSLSSPL